MMNKVILLGNLGKNPEIFTTEQGSKICSFSVATSENYKNKAGEKVNETEWHNVKCFGHLAEICEKYLKKGDKIYLEGKIKTTSKDGKYFTSIVMSEMKMIGSQSQKPGVQSEEGFNTDESDDLPF